MNEEEKHEIIKKEEHRLKRELRKQTFGYVVGALSLVAGLAWNEAVKAVIDYVFPFDRSGIWIKFIYAGVLTLIVIIFSVYIGRIINPSEESKRP